LGILLRHIAARYLVNVFALFVVLFAFVLVVDVFSNMRSYISAAEEIRPEWGGLATAGATALVIVDLWGPRLLQLFTYLTGVVLIAGMGFTCVQFVRRGEFIAALASGLSLHRLMLPFLLVALGISALSALNQEFALPRVGHLLGRGPDEVATGSLATVQGPIATDASGRVFYAGRFLPDEGALEDVHIWERTETGAIARRIRADSAVWDGSGWTLESGRSETPARPGVFNPVDRIDSDLEPRVILLHQVQGYGQSLSWREIASTLERGEQLDERSRRSLERIAYGRAALLVSNVLTLVIAMSFFLVKVPGNMVAQTLKVAPLGAAALIGSTLGVAAPLPGLAVEIAVFVPTLVLLPIAIWALTTVRS